MTNLDKTFCASPNCTNECGRQMSKEMRQDLDMLVDAGFYTFVSCGYFCGEPEKMTTDDYDDAMLLHEIYRED